MPHQITLRAANSLEFCQVFLDRCPFLYFHVAMVTANILKVSYYGVVLPSNNQSKFQIFFTQQQLTRLPLSQQRIQLELQLTIIFTMD